MTKELTVAYPRLRKDWKRFGGSVVRISTAHNRSIPDFVLCHPDIIPTFVEVKCIKHITDAIEFEPLQQVALRGLKEHGAGAIAACWCMETQWWAIFDASIHATSLGAKSRVALRYGAADRHYAALSPAAVQPWRD